MTMMNLTFATPTTEYMHALPAVTILAVDDREDNLLSIEKILEKEGYTVEIGRE